MGYTAQQIHYQEIEVSKKKSAYNRFKNLASPSLKISLENEYLKEEIALLKMKQKWNTPKWQGGKKGDG